MTRLASQPSPAPLFTEYAYCSASGLLPSDEIVEILADAAPDPAGASLMFAHASAPATMTSPGETEVGHARDATMLRDNLVGLIEPMLDSAGADPLAGHYEKKAVGPQEPK